ncbi:MAG: DUF3429 domain-containing protein [Gammaproteobacteria bacterium]|nr:DUF3429 domain-containing protein [Gammaproteobacteria bacterium]MDH3448219.1 DUF3429 domain-containing protein [Gammaproteobacteria bacterium]
MTNVTRVVSLLGYAGLVPFVFPALLVATGSEFSQLSLQLAGIYAFAITSFLTGSWWGMALSTGSRALLVSSNLLFLVGFFVFVFAPDWWPLAAALVLLTILVAERSGSFFPAFPDRYRGMRTWLTLIASAAMLTLQIAG